MKLRSRLSVAAKPAADYRAKAARRSQMPAEGTQALRPTEEPWQAHEAEMRATFEKEVMADTPEKVAARVQEGIDWLVERELELWRKTAAEPGRRRETSALHGAAQEAAG